MSDDARVQRVRPDSSLVRTIRDAVEAFLASVDDDLVAAIYLYGSAARGRVTGLSDLDVAVLYCEGVGQDRRWQELPRLGSAIARSLAVEGTGAPDVDVHDLASIPIAVQGRVLTEGVLVLSTDEVRRVRFEERTRRRYFDFLPFQERDTEEGLAGLRERVDGG